MSNYTSICDAQVCPQCEESFVMKVGDVARKRRFHPDRRSWIGAYRTWRQSRRMWGRSAISYEELLATFRAK
jgi:hypothetical protein